jgi:hypothetical protein
MHSGPGLRKDCDGYKSGYSDQKLRRGFVVPAALDQRRGRPRPQIDKTILGDNVLTNEEILIGLPGYQITGIAIESGEVRI